MEIILSTTADELYYADIMDEVSFELEETPELNDYADSIRDKKGFIPFFDSRKECWYDGWYEFYLRVNLIQRKIIDISFVVKGNCSDKSIVPDDDEVYILSDYIDTIGVMGQLEKQLEKYDTTLDEIVKEIEEIT